MKLVMFDIDGTLIHSLCADDACFAQALHEVFGFTDVDTDWSTYRHCSDSAILDELFQRRLGRSPRAEETTAVQERFTALLAEAIREQPFAEVPGAKEFVRTLLADDDFAVSLASGAWQCAARVKLAGAGFELPHLPAAFGDDAHPREAIMQTSATRAAQHHARDTFDEIIYIGDGVWDVRAAANLGYRFLGIAHEPAKIERLRAAGARHVLPDFRNVVALATVLHNCSI